MAKVRSKDTLPELTVRRQVFGLGYRYRLHDSRLPGKPDLVFRSRQKVLFVHGCFWHGHKNCRKAGLPKSRRAFWNEKIERNRARDKKVIAQLRRDGWRALVIWQCQLKDIESVTARIRRFLEE